MNIFERIEKEGIRRRFSPRTIESYKYIVAKFLERVGKKPEEITKKDIREYLEDLAERGKSGNSLNLHLNALKFCFEGLLGRKMKLDIRYSKSPVKLPLVLSKEEVKLLFSVIKNPKHRLMIKLMYGAGLRVSELINLKIKNLEINKNYGYVRNGKGGKDRLFIIPDSLKEKIKELIKDKNKDNYLFSSNRDNKYNIRSLQEIVKKASKSAGLDYKKIHCHTLRHSFATHLIEQGNSISDVQVLLGHKSPETTMIYLHTASNKLINIKSPIDSL